MATRGIGTTIKSGTQKIGSLTSIGGIEITADTMDVTDLDSEGGYRKFIKTFRDGGEVPLEGFFDAEDTGQAAMQASIDSDDEEEYTIDFPTNPKASWTFKGIVTGFKVGDIELDGAIAFAATIKVSGKPELSMGTVAGP